MRNRSSLPAIALLLMLAFLTGCANTPTQIAYKSLATVGATENAAVAEAWTLYHSNQITASQWKAVASLHDQKFVPAWNTALDAAIAAVRLSEASGSGSVAQAMMTQAPADLVQISSDVLTLVATFKH